MAPVPPPTIDQGESHTSTKPIPQQNQQQQQQQQQQSEQKSVWVVRPGNSGRVLAVAAEITAPQQGHPPIMHKSNNTNMIPPPPTPRDSLVMMSTSRIPRSLAVSDMAESFDQQQQRQHCTSPGRDRTHIDDVNRRWDEMMKSTTPVPSSLTGSVPTSAKNLAVASLTSAPSSATMYGGSGSRGSGSGASTALKFGSDDEVLGFAETPSKSGETSKIGSSNSNNLNTEKMKKTKKSISFSENLVMYRSLSNIDIDQASIDLQQAALMAVSELWSDDDEDEEGDQELYYNDDGYQNTEDDTLYSEEGNDWPKNDEFEEIADGTNIMSLPTDEDDDARISSPIRDLTVSGQNISTSNLPVGPEIPAQRVKLSSPNSLDTQLPSGIIPVVPTSPLSRSTFNASPVHRFLKNQHLIPVPSSRSELTTLPQMPSLSPAAVTLVRQPTKEDIIPSSLVPQTIINNQVINLQIPSDIHDLCLESSGQRDPLASPRGASFQEIKKKVHQSSKSSSPQQRIPSSSSNTHVFGCTPPPIISSSPSIPNQDIPQSPRSLRAGSGSTSVASSSVTGKSHLKSSKSSADDKFSRDETCPQSSIASSSPWIKRASAVEASSSSVLGGCGGHELHKKPQQQQLQDFGVTLKTLYNGVDPSSNEIKTMKGSGKKEGMSTDSLVFLEEGEIVLENVRQDGAVNSAAFFIPLGDENRIENEINDGKGVNGSPIKSSYSSEFNIEDDTESISAAVTSSQGATKNLIGKQPAIPSADPVVVVVAPQSPQLISNSRSNTSDGWIKSKNGVLGANVGDSMFITKESILSDRIQAPSPRLAGKPSSIGTPPILHTPTASKKGKSSPSEVTKSAARTISMDDNQTGNESSDHVPIVVVKMAGDVSSLSTSATATPTGSRKQNSPAKIRQPKPKTIDTFEYYSEGGSRDSNVTLVNSSRESSTSLKRSPDSSFGGRVLMHRVNMPESFNYQEFEFNEAGGMRIDKKSHFLQQQQQQQQQQQIYPHTNHRMSMTQRGYVPMPASKLNASNASMYNGPYPRTAMIPSENLKQYQKYNNSNPNQVYPSPRSSMSTCTAPSSLYNSSPQYQSQSQLYTNRNIHKWANSTPSISSNNQQPPNNSTTGYQTSPLGSNSFSTQEENSSIPPQFSSSSQQQQQHSPRRKQSKNHASNNGTSLKSLSPSSTTTKPSPSSSKSKQLRNLIITAPPNSVNSSRATTPLVPPERKHYRRISFGSTTSSLRSSVRGGPNGMRGAGGSGVFMEDCTVGVQQHQPPQQAASDASDNASIKSGLSINGRAYSFENANGVAGGGGNACNNASGVRDGGISTGGDEKQLRYFPFNMKASRRDLRRVGIERPYYYHHTPPPPTPVDGCGAVHVEEILDGSEEVQLVDDDGIEIVEGRRSYPSLPKQQEYPDAGILKNAKRRRMGSVVKNWFYNIWRKAVGVFVIRRK
ncbi:hypothetical protein BDR26DRAFT_515978 [Obelidium mucronatum]|nr:hypothetical protein BDR26DRAFT_515978 [Obelidium mucronatum]